MKIRERPAKILRCQVGCEVRCRRRCQVLKWNLSLLQDRHRLLIFRRDGNHDARLRFVEKALSGRCDVAVLSRSISAPRSPSGLKQHSASATASPPSQQSCALSPGPRGSIRARVLHGHFHVQDRGAAAVLLSGRDRLSENASRRVALAAWHPAGQRLSR